jgi:uncharacterized protein YjbI with pentapeptide repeats
MIEILANQEHVDILRQGAKVWNQWREEHPEILPDLVNADLIDADFGFANLSGAKLRRASLRGANFSYANLSHAGRFDADLRGANLNHAYLGKADLRSANLTDANLSKADLRSANLSYVNLHGANFINTKIGWTIFGELDLRTVKGLETVRHLNPSIVGIDTIYRSGGNIPESFLRGAGIPETFITYARSLVNNPIEYYTCFISYSSKDQAFAERLYADLQSNNVRCWYAPEDMNIGDKIRPRIDESIRLYDKLLVILSENSVTSSWVAYEVERALNKEPKGVPNVLYPIRLDDAVLTCTASWAQDIRETSSDGKTMTITRKASSDCCEL